MMQRISKPRTRLKMLFGNNPDNLFRKCPECGRRYDLTSVVDHRCHECLGKEDWLFFSKKSQSFSERYMAD